MRVIVANSVEDIVKKGCFYVIYVLVKRAYEVLYGSLAGRVRDTQWPPATAHVALTAFARIPIC